MNGNTFGISRTVFSQLDADFCIILFQSVQNKFQPYLIFKVQTGRHYDMFKKKSCWLKYSSPFDTVLFSAGMLGGKSKESCVCVALSI